MEAPESQVPVSAVADTPLSEAAAAFRRYFLECRDAFLERDTLFTQLELALLSKEHALIIGPPGTAKSAIAGAVLGRIVDETTGRPSLFSKQLAENTVQTDLIGAVDFKVLTETGRTEYLTEEGMLGAAHAFLDEVFDGRDMLLRSILNVLHERELKHGKKVTLGKCECVVMTSNRYLSEVLQRSPETLQAFADRISFTAFAPKSFARKASRGQMLARSAQSQRPPLVQRLTLQQLDVLQDAVARVELPAAVSEGIELLADSLERALLAQVAKLPDYVPTKYFSHRSLVKAQWVLKAAVVRDLIHQRPERPLAAEFADLAALRHFYLLGGPPPEDLEQLLKSAADPRERAQLEILRLEHRVFDEALGKLRPQLDTSGEREAGELQLKDLVAAAEAQVGAWAPALAGQTAQLLLTRLNPGPRHPENRGRLLRAAEALVTALEQHALRGAAGSHELSTAVVLDSYGSVLELARKVPELADRMARVTRAITQFGVEASQMLALAAEATQFENGLSLESLANVAGELAQKAGALAALTQRVAMAAEEQGARLQAAATDAKHRAAAALRHRAERVFAHLAFDPDDDLLDALVQEGRRLRALEAALHRLNPVHEGLRAALLAPLAERYLRQTVGRAEFRRIEQLVWILQGSLDDLRREGLAPGPMLRSVWPDVELRVGDHARLLRREAAVDAPSQAQALSGEAYRLYKDQHVARSLDGEALALRSLISLGEQPLGRGVTQAVLDAELSSLTGRVRFLRGWLTVLLAGLPAAEKLGQASVAERAFEQLVRSRLPLLVTKEGELVRLASALNAMNVGETETASVARRHEEIVGQLGAELKDYAERVLAGRRQGA